MDKFDDLCESFGIIKQTKRIMYPRQINLSEEFMQALKSEYYRLTLEEDSEQSVKNRPEKFIKALQFHVRDLENNKEAELEALRAMMDENTDEYEVKVEDEKEEGCNCSNPKKEAQRRKEVEKENMVGVEERSRYRSSSKYNKKEPEMDGDWDDRQPDETPEEAQERIDRHYEEKRRRRNKY